MRAFVLGAITGAAVAILFAPAAGPDTRDAIGDRVHEVAERIRAARRRMLRGASAPLTGDDLEPEVFPGSPA